MSDIVSISGLSHAAPGSQLHLDQARGANGVAPADSTGSSAASSGVGGDSVALSGAAGLIHQALNAGSDARSARVQQLKQQIESGQYAIDSAAIGNAIVNAGIAGE
jgi:flagellar biosynthesis anti-sigma factor FlgM